VNTDQIVDALAASGKVSRPLAAELIRNFVELRNDASTGTLGRSSPGLFIESFAQVLEALAGRVHEPRARVDGILRSLESESSLDDGLRLCATRVALAIYSLRSHRSIIHQGKVDANISDLQFLYRAAQWCLSEVLRNASGVSMAEAGRLIEQIEAPLLTVVEDFGNRRLVLDSELVAADEILVFLHSYYPESVSSRSIKNGVDRHSEKTIENTLPKLWADRLIERVGAGHKLTGLGHRRASSVIVQIVERQTATMPPPLRMRGPRRPNHQKAQRDPLVGSSH
jgi:hypothetical protein